MNTNKIKFKKLLIIVSILITLIILSFECLVIIYATGNEIFLSAERSGIRASRASEIEENLYNEEGDDNLTVNDTNENETAQNQTIDNNIMWTKVMPSLSIVLLGLGIILFAISVFLLIKQNKQTSGKHDGKSEEDHKEKNSIINDGQTNAIADDYSKNESDAKLGSSIRSVIEYIGEIRQEIDYAYNDEVNDDLKQYSTSALGEIINKLNNGMMEYKPKIGESFDPYKMIDITPENSYRGDNPVSEVAEVGLRVGDYVVKRAKVIREVKNDLDDSIQESTDVNAKDNLGAINNGDVITEFAGNNKGDGNKGGKQELKDKK